jgi:hypothetical protein
MYEQEANRVFDLVIKMQEPRVLQQKKPNYEESFNEQETEKPDWFVKKTVFGGSDLNFPFIITTASNCRCNNIKFDQEKKGGFWLFYEDNRKSWKPACSTIEEIKERNKEGWCSDTFMLGDNRAATGPRNIEDWAKGGTPIKCFPKNNTPVTYAFYDAPGYEKNFGWPKNRPVIGIKWNAGFRHRLFCRDTEIFSKTFTLTGSKTRKKDTRKIREGDKVE